VRKALLAGLAGFLLLGGLAGGLAWVVRRPALAGPPEDEGAQSVKVTPAGEGLLLEIQDGGLPMRSLRWTGPLPGGVVVAQASTQSDRQQVAVLKEGRSLGLFLVPRPGGVGEGLFNHAELRDAVLAEGDLLVLLYRPLAGSEVDPVLVLALDLPSRTLRWCHRAPGEHLALAGNGKDAAVILWGRNTPIQRLPLALQKGEREGAAPVRDLFKPYELPEEVGERRSLVPTGAWTFLLAHAGGLSAYNGSVKGWAHLPAPPEHALGFPQPKGVVVKAGDRYWWQPEPGAVVPVQADATPLAEAEPQVLAVPEPALDGPMLQLFGGDADGRLWFTLAAPTLRAPVPRPPAKGEAAGGEAAEGDAAQAAAPAVPEFTAEELLAWETHLRGDLGRLYVLDPAKRSLHRVAWAEAWPVLGAPEGFARPALAAGVKPEAGGALFTSDLGAWWVPLKALPMKVVAPAAGRAPGPGQEHTAPKPKS
jgi:hypothetical protein